MRALSVPWAKGAAGRPLLAEFSRSPTAAHSLRWSIGNAIEVLADDTLGENILRIVSDATNGAARQMFVLSLGKIRHPDSVPTLMALLADEEVVGHAAEALGRLRALEAVPLLEALSHRATAKPWVRKAAVKALTRIQKSQIK